MTTVLLFLLFGAVCYRLGYHGRGWLLEHREQMAAYRQSCADRDRETAQAIRAQAEDMLIDAEWSAITARALTTDTQPLPTIRVHVTSGWTGLREWSRSTFGDDGHKGWEGAHADELAVIRRQHVSRAGWPLRARKMPTPLVMPQHLPPDPERSLRVHTLARTT